MKAWIIAIIAIGCLLVIGGITTFVVISVRHHGPKPSPPTDKCKGKKCPPGQKCNPGTGACDDDLCKKNPCNRGEDCIGGQCICNSSFCLSPYSCKDGRCVCQCATGFHCNPETLKCDCDKADKCDSKTCNPDGSCKCPDKCDANMYCDEKTTGGNCAPCSGTNCTDLKEGVCPCGGDKGCKANGFPCKCIDDKGNPAPCDSNALQPSSSSAYKCGDTYGNMKLCGLPDCTSCTKAQSCQTLTNAKLPNPYNSTAKVCTDTTCPSGKTPCGSTCCDTGTICTQPDQCCPSALACHGNQCCNPSHQDVCTTEDGCCPAASAYPDKTKCCPEATNLCHGTKMTSCCSGGDYCLPDGSCF